MNSIQDYQDTLTEETAIWGHRELKKQLKELNKPQEPLEETSYLYAIIEKFYTDEFIPRKAIRPHIKFKWAEGFTAGITAGIILTILLSKIILRFV